jgi:hypothetical protein
LTSRVPAKGNWAIRRHRIISISRSVGSSVVRIAFGGSRVLAGLGRIGFDGRSWALRDQFCSSNSDAGTMIGKAIGITALA